jgi:hypothetical protein
LDANGLCYNWVIKWPVIWAPNICLRWTISHRLMEFKSSKLRITWGASHGQFQGPTDSLSAKQIRIAGRIADQKTPPRRQPVALPHQRQRAVPDSVACNGGQIHSGFLKQRLNGNRSNRVGTHDRGPYEQITPSPRIARRAASR